MKNKIISILVILILSVSIFLVSFANKNYSKAKEVYQVYLNGNKIGMIANDEDLYDLINERQKEIKEKKKLEKAARFEKSMTKLFGLLIGLAIIIGIVVVAFILKK